jgi:hypothetical protein
LRQALQELVIAARTRGLVAYASIGVRLAERLEPMCRAGYVSPWVLALLGEWALVSMRYAQGLDDWMTSLTLMSLLTDRRWDWRTDTSEVRTLLQALQAEQLLCQQQEALTAEASGLRRAHAADRRAP